MVVSFDPRLGPSLELPLRPDAASEACRSQVSHHHEPLGTFALGTDGAGGVVEPRLEPMARSAQEGAVSLSSLRLSDDKPQRHAM